MKLDRPGSADTLLASTTARLLHASATALGALGLLSLALAGAALLLHPAPAAAARALLLAVLAVAPIERLLALRLHFDAGLFADLSVDLGRPGAVNPLSALDQALQTLRLRPPSPALRPLAERANGACRLLFWHACCVVLQFGAVATAVVAWPPRGAS